MFQIFIGYWTIWDRIVDKRKRYRRYKVHVGVFLYIAGENDEDFDTEGSLYAFSSTVPITPRAIPYLQAGSCRSIPWMSQCILVQRVLYAEEHTTQSIIELQRILVNNGDKLLSTLIAKATHSITLAFDSTHLNSMLIIRTRSMDLKYLIEYKGAVFVEKDTPNSANSTLNFWKWDSGSCLTNKFYHSQV